MTFPSEFPGMTPAEVRDYVFARARDLAFDAVYALWQRRKAEGPRSQKELAERLQKTESWVSRSLQGPGNWTLRTLAELTEALDGELEIVVRPIEESPYRRANYHAYANYPAPYLGTRPITGTSGHFVTTSGWAPEVQPAQI